MLVENVTHLLNALVMVRRNSRVSGGLTSMRSCFEAASKVVTTLRAGIGTVGMSSQESSIRSPHTLLFALLVVLRRTLRRELRQRLNFTHMPTIEVAFEQTVTPPRKSGNFQGPARHFP